MSAQPAAQRQTSEPTEFASAMTSQEQLQYAQQIIRSEGQHLVRLASDLDIRITKAAERILQCKGSVVVTGIGKAGIIGLKLSATLSSTGTRSHFLHSAEAFHGDLGKVQSDDIVIVLSHSGKTEEIVRLLPSLKQQASSVIAMTASQRSPLGQAADLVLELGETKEACNLGLAPSTSTTAMIAIGDALALLVSRVRGFTHQDFAQYHPGGNLGAKLATVDQAMRTLDCCRMAADTTSVREVLMGASKTGRRSGAVMLIDLHGNLSGIFTDSDLARLLERRRDGALDGPVADVMTRGMTTVNTGSLLVDAVSTLAERKISELPVVDNQRKPIGMIDITDVVGLFPSDDQDLQPTVLPFPGVEQS